MPHFKDTAGRLHELSVQDVANGGLSLLPADCVEITDAEAEQIRAAAAQTAEQIIAGIASMVQQHMDAAAKARGYDDIKSAVTYADEPSVPKFQLEGRAFRSWRSLVWDRCYTLLAEVNAGTRQPMTADQVIAELPALTI
ncbi:MAG TPA: hypothetical protein VLT92_02725 [Burkholderiales bacterium]|nr:hypothetical protein [Burkholderiales bacterium]